MAKFYNNLKANNNFSKPYIESLLKEFTKDYCQNEPDIVALSFGKTDQRGIFNITAIYDGGNVRKLESFCKTNELLEFVRGYNFAMRRKK